MAPTTATLGRDEAATVVELPTTAIAVTVAACLATIVITPTGGGDAWGVTGIVCVCGRNGDAATVSRAITSVGATYIGFCESMRNPTMRFGKGNM